MKLYEFRCLLWSFGIVMILLLVFIYGLIWLDKGFKVEDQMALIRKEFNEKYELKGFHEELKEPIKDDVLRNEIMPSCFKGISSRAKAQRP